MSRNGEDESDPNDSNPGDDKTFINKLLVQMKTQFNNKTDPKTEVDENSSTMENVVSQEDISPPEAAELMESEEYEAKSEVTEPLTDCEISEEDEHKSKPRIVLTFRKPSLGKSKSKPARNRENSKEVILKRSSRRRSKDCNESVLQSAIARKEKSYNESNKPQRLTRQLKPTQKILDNIASAAVKLEKNKRWDDVEDASKKSRNKTVHLKNGKGDSKRLKLARDVEADLKLSDSNSSLSSESSKVSEGKSSKDFVGEEKSCRRSLRISSR